MKANYFYILLFVLFSNLLQAQEVSPPANVIETKKDTSYWVKTLKTGFNVNQLYFTDNWKGGGTNNVNYLFYLLATANYKKDKISFDNSLDVQYGSAYLKTNEQFRKTNDRLLLDSKLGYKLSKNWNAFASFNLLTQFDAGYNYKKDEITNQEVTTRISGLFAPAYLTETFGAEYKPVDYWFLRLGLAALKQTIVSDTSIFENVPTRYGLKAGKKSRNEFGLLNISSGFNKNIAKNVNLKILYQMFFNNYSYFFEPIETYPKNMIEAYIDQRFDVTVTFKVNKYISSQFNYVGLYDFDQDKNYQAAQSISLGVAISLPESKK